MDGRRVWCLFPILLLLSISPLFGQVDLVTNGSFEDGMTGWSWGAYNPPGVSGTCSYNLVTAPGVEALTSTSGFPATDGAKIMLGSVSATSQPSTARSTCALYQDIPIPSGPTTLTLKVDLSVKPVVVGGCGYTLVLASLFPPESTLAYGESSQFRGPSVVACNPSSNLTTYTAVLTQSDYYWPVLRLAILNTARDQYPQVIGIDRVQLIASPAPAITSVSRTSGTTMGGDVVTITGTRLGGTTGVTFEYTPATSFTVVNDTTIQVVSPAHAAGSAMVFLSGSFGTIPVTIFDYAVPTPTLSEWGLILMSGLLLGYGWMKLRHKGGDEKPGLT